MKIEGQGWMNIKRLWKTLGPWEKRFVAGHRFSNKTDAGSLSIRCPIDPLPELDKAKKIAIEIREPARFLSHVQDET